MCIRDSLATVLYNLLECIRFSAVLLSSYMPETADKILEELSTSERDADSLKEFGMLECGHTVEGKPEILFARIDAKEFMETLEADRKKEEKAAKKADKKEAKKEDAPVEQIGIEDFTKVELKVGDVYKRQADAVCLCGNQACNLFPVCPFLQLANAGGTL